jgi:hypothetical protein
VLVLNVLIVVAALASVGVIGVLALGGVSSLSSLKIGSPTSVTAGSTTTITVPVTVGNRGYLALSGIDVRVAVTDSAGDELINGTVGPITVPPGQAETFDATLVLDTSKLSPAALQSLATTAQDLTVSASLGAAVPPFVAVSGSVTAQLKWGAPVTNLTEGAPAFRQYNSTTIEVMVPVSFTNENGYYTVSGNGVVTVLNSSGAAVGGGSVSLDVPPGSKFSKTVDLFVTLPRSQLQSLLTHDQTLLFTAELGVPTGPGSSFSLSQPISVAWGAPLAGLAEGVPSVSAYNSTAFQVSVPVSFTDNSTSISVDAVISAAVYNATSGQEVGSGTLTVVASPGASFSQDMTLYLKVPSSSLQYLLFNDATLSFTMTATGTASGVSFTLAEPVTVDWGAPVESLAFGSLSYAPLNATYSRASIPVSFTDASTFIALSGTFSGYVTDSAGNEVGTISSLAVNVTPGQRFSGTLTAEVLNSALAGGGSFTLHLTCASSWGTATTEVVISG